MRLLFLTILAILLIRIVFGQDQIEYDVYEYPKQTGVEITYPENPCQW